MFYMFRSMAFLLFFDLFVLFINLVFRVTFNFAPVKVSYYHFHLSIFTCYTLLVP